MVTHRQGFRSLSLGKSSCDRVALPSLLCMLVFQCFHNPPNSDMDCRFHNPPNSDMDYRIFNVRIDLYARDCTRRCTDTVKESALKVDSGRKIPCRTGESNLPQRHAGPTLYQLSYTPLPPQLHPHAFCVQQQNQQ